MRIRVVAAAAAVAAMIVLGCTVDQVVGITVADAGSPDSGPQVCADYTCTPSCSGQIECTARCDAGDCAYHCEGTCTPTCPVGACQLDCGGAADGGPADCQVVCSGNRVCAVLDCREDNCTVGCGTPVEADGGCP